jgi:hypothetical protein
MNKEKQNGKPQKSHEQIENEYRGFYIRGFNFGYWARKHKPEVLVDYYSKKSVISESPFTIGVSRGKAKFEAELIRDKFEELKRLRMEEKEKGGVER